MDASYTKCRGLLSMAVTKEVSKTFLSWVFSRCQGGKGTMFARRDHYLQIFCLAGTIISFRRLIAYSVAYHLIFSLLSVSLMPFIQKVIIQKCCQNLPEVAQIQEGFMRLN